MEELTDNRWHRIRCIRDKSWQVEWDELRSVEITSWCFAKEWAKLTTNVSSRCFSVLIGSSLLMPVELSARLHSRVDMWRHCGGMSCTCPGRLEVSRDIMDAKHVTSERHQSLLRWVKSQTQVTSSPGLTCPLARVKPQWSAQHIVGALEMEWATGG